MAVGRTRRVGFEVKLSCIADFGDCLPGVDGAAKNKAAFAQRVLAHFAIIGDVAAVAFDAPLTPLAFAAPGLLVVEMED